MNDIFPLIPETMSKRDLFAKDIFCALLRGPHARNNKIEWLRQASREQADALIQDLKTTAAKAEACLKQKEASR